jgi:hypothetical protein
VVLTLHCGCLLWAIGCRGWQFAEAVNAEICMAWQTRAFNRAFAVILLVCRCVQRCVCVCLISDILLVLVLIHSFRMDYDWFWFCLSFLVLVLRRAVSSSITNLLLSQPLHIWSPLSEPDSASLTARRERARRLQNSRKRRQISP